MRGGWNAREGPSSPTPDSNPPIRPDQGIYIPNVGREIFAEAFLYHNLFANFFIFCFRLELTQRLDYVLRAVGLGRNYLYTVTAHTAYWNNYDVAYFVLTRLFPTPET